MKIVFEFLKMSKNIKFCPESTFTGEKRKLDIIASPPFLFIDFHKYKNEIDNGNALLFYFMY